MTMCRRFFTICVRPHASPRPWCSRPVTAPRSTPKWKPSTAALPMSPTNLPGSPGQSCPILRRTCTSTMRRGLSATCSQSSVAWIRCWWGRPRSSGRCARPFGRPRSRPAPEPPSAVCSRRRCGSASAHTVRPRSVRPERRSCRSGWAWPWLCGGAPQSGSRWPGRCRRSTHLPGVGSCWWVRGSWERWLRPWRGGPVRPNSWSRTVPRREPDESSRLTRPRWSR